MQPLDGIRVLDLSTEQSGRFCGRMLAEFGAAVVRPDGLTPPTPDLPQADRRAAAIMARGEDIFLDHGKRPAPPITDGDALAAACRAVDVVIETWAPGGLRARGVDPEALARAGVTVVSITPFGQDGPRAGWQGTELTMQAYGGFLGLSGYPNREPVQAALEQMGLVAGRAGAYGALAALYARPPGGAGRWVDIAVAEVAASLPPFHIQQYTHTGAVAARGPLVQQVLDGRHLATRDGYVCFATGGVQPFEMFSVLLEEPALLDDRFRTAIGRREHAAELDAIVMRRVAAYGKYELFRRAIEHRIVAGVVQTPDDLIACPHLAAQGFYRDTSTTEGTVRVPGLGVRLTAPTTAAPSTSPPPDPAPSSAAGPLAGVRIVTVEDYLFLPWATVQLANLGAEVIRVESRSRVANRLMGFYPHNRPGEDYWNESSAYSSFERNKASLTLDLAAPEGREAFLRLVATADIVMENNRPGVLERLGVGEDALCAANPRLVIMRCSGYGQDGPYRNAGAFARTIDAMSGLTDLTGYTDGEPLRANPSLMDMVSAWNNACAAVTGLLARRQSGGGVRIDVSMYSTGVSTVGAAVVARQLGAELVRAGNLHHAMAPHGVYRCRDEDAPRPDSERPDRWLAIAVRDDAEWARLADLIGEPWAAAEDLRGLPGRFAARHWLDERLAAWTGDQDAFDLERRLQERGIPAAVARDARDLVLDEHLRRRGFFQWVRTGGTNGSGGFVTPHPGLALHIDGHRPGETVAAAAMGADNHRLLTELGYDAAAIARMAAAGVIGDAPTPGAAPRPEPANLHRLGVAGTVRMVDAEYDAVVTTFRAETAGGAR
ncbi:MAG: CoA transferase [Dehalococcoidia bacterium]